MSEFRTVISTPPSSHKIALNQQILTFGSCFSDAIGYRLRRNKFSVDVNPFGIIYNPIALHRVISYAAREQMPPTDSSIKNSDVFLNYDFHSIFSAMEAESLSQQLSKVIHATNATLKTADHIFITYGTAWVYELKSNHHIVANCHKMPSSFFEKRLLHVDEITKSFHELYAELKQVTPDVQIILTVSPVRHIKDTLPLNSVSKSILRTACHYLAEEFSGVEYFPAFEIMMDDLRDYRFYKSDMIHPTEQAEEYIWEAFTEKYITSQGRQFIRQWQGIQNALQHKPFHPGSSGHKNFLIDLLEKLEGLKGVVQIDDEITVVKAQLEKHFT
jgi:hypothetical protein